MNEETKAAIPQVKAVCAEDQRTGTAFVISDRFALTAFHVVGDRAGALRGGDPSLSKSITLTFRGMRTASASVMSGTFSASDDWALLCLDRCPPDVTPVRLGALSAGSRLDFESYGYPAEHQNPLTVAGEVRDPAATYFGARVIQLFCKELAAALGDPLNGMSGAPCLVEGIAVGVMRAHPVTQSDFHRSRVTVRNGVLYACPTSQFRNAVEPYAIEIATLDDSGTPIPSQAEFADAASALVAIPIGPIVRAHEIPETIIKVFGERFVDPNRARHLFSHAMYLLEQCNPEHFTAQQLLLTHGEVLSPFQNPADLYWADVFTAAGAKSRRTLAAFLVVPGGFASETLSPDVAAVFLGFKRWLGQTVGDFETQ